MKIPESLIQMEDNDDEDRELGIGMGYGTKIQALIVDLEFVRAQDLVKGEVTKSVIFSQFTSMLTLCQVRTLIDL